MSRPALTPALSSTEFRAWYWLKQELVVFCQTYHLDTSGAKQNIAERIADFLSTGIVPPPVPRPRRVTDTMPTVFSRATVIGKHWRCSEALRAFFIQEIGPQFHFDQTLRTFIKEGEGQTLDAAIGAWVAARQHPTPTEIAPQFEYNRFLRAYRHAHPGAPRAEAVAAWHAHKAQRKQSDEGAI